jgi:hypothetical protein
MTDRMIGMLNTRMTSAEGQSSEDVARVISNLIILKRQAKHLIEVPFNIGTSPESQSVLEQVRKQPTGWGGLYNNILASVPPLPEFSAAPGASKDEL